MKTLKNKSRAYLFLCICAGGFLAFVTTQGFSQARWTGNVPSISKIGDSWQVTNVIPDLSAYSLTDESNKPLCVQRHYMVGTQPGVIDAGAIRFSEYTFNGPQGVTWEEKSYQINKFVFAFHGDDKLYTNINELVIPTTFSTKMGWVITNGDGKVLALVKMKMRSINDCTAVYESGVTVSRKDFHSRYIAKYPND
jgi:hypothetical protein